MNIEDILKKIDKSQLIKIASTKEGKELLSKLTDEDKRRLMREFNKLDPNKVKQKLNELNRNGMGNMSTDEIIKNIGKIK